MVSLSLKGTLKHSIGLNVESVYTVEVYTGNTVTCMQTVAELFNSTIDDVN